MNVNEYIASGTLELYVAGVLSEAEAREVEQMAEKYPEVAKEIAAIEERYLRYAEGHAVEPSKGLKASVMAAIESDEPSEGMHEGPAQGSDLPRHRIRDRQKVTLWPYKLALAASIILLIVSGYYNFHIYSKYKDTRESLISLRQEKQKIASKLNKARDTLKETKTRFNTLFSGNTRFVSLKGVKGHEDNEVHVFWNPHRKHVFLRIQNLPASPHGKQYQLWAISGDDIRSAGVFDCEQAKKRLTEMKMVDQADAFAITLEPEGGSQSPTLEQMYVKGKI